MSEFADWQAVLSRIRERRPAVADVFAEARVLAFGAERVDIGFPITSDAVAAATASSSTLREALAEHFGVPRVRSASSGCCLRALSPRRERRGPRGP